MRSISKDAKKTAVTLLMKYAVNVLSDLLFSTPSVRLGFSL